jgi:adenosylhomocysteine nucleosidase
MGNEVNAEGCAAFLSAEPFELQDFARCLDSLSETHLPLRWARVGKWKGRRVVLAADGAGVRLARHAAEILIARMSPTEIWSVGLCGALRDTIRRGDVVTGASVIDATSKQRYPTADLGGATSIVWTQDRIASTAEEKRQLSAFADIVDMEASAVADAAMRAGIPFHCVKSVSDEAHESFVIDLNAARDADGRFRPVRIVSMAAARSWRGIGELVRLRNASRMASRRLGEFLANR